MCVYACVSGTFVSDALGIVCVYLCVHVCGVCLCVYSFVYCLVDMSSHSIKLRVVAGDRYQSTTGTVCVVFIHSLSIGWCEPECMRVYKPVNVCLLHVCCNFTFVYIID